MDNLKTISPTITAGYKKSRIDSPDWVDSYAALEMIIKKYHIKNMAEIGVCRGHLSAHLLEAVPDLRVYSIDPWGYFNGEYDNMYAHHTLRDDENLYKSVCQLLEPFGERSIIIRFTSCRAAGLIKQPLDMVYLDADHSYEGYKEDLNLWWNKVKAGGVFSGRDYGHQSHPGVTQAVDEFFKSKNLKFNLEIGRVWWLEKSPAAEAIISQPEQSSKPAFFLRLQRKCRRVKANFRKILNTMKFFLKKIPGLNYIKNKLHGD